MLTLTNKEREMVALIAKGHTNKEIAALTKYTVLSVDTIRTRMLRKNSVKNTAHLISECYQQGILKVMTMLVLLSASACSSREGQLQPHKQEPIQFMFSAEIKTIEHEGCEYVTARTHDGLAIIHKANCKNPTHTIK